ncbi:MAG: ATP-binding cassette domain-containing protein [Pseudomonadota bacterium]
MSDGIAGLTALFARRRGAELSPDWLAAVETSDLDGESSEDLAELCRRLGWMPPHRIDGRPRANQFPLMTFDSGVGWAIAEQWESLETIRVTGGRNGTTRPLTATTDFFDLRLPRTRQDDATTSALSVIWRAVVLRKSVFVAATVATIMVNLIALATSLYSMQVYDRVIPRSGFDTLWVLTVGVLFALGIDFALRTTRALMIEREAAKIDAEVSEFFFARAQSIRLDARPPGIGTMAAQLRGWEQVRGLLSSGFIFLLADLPFAIFFLLVIAALGGVIALVPLLTFPLSLGLGVLFTRLIRSDTHQAHQSSNRKNGLLVESFDAAETVKANRAGWHMLARWNSLMDELQLYEDGVKRWSSVATTVFSSLQQASYILLVAWGAVRVSDGEMSMGALIACTILSGRVTGPLVAQLPGFLVQWGYARSSLHALDRMMNLPLDQAHGVEALRPERLQPSLRLDNVGFAYPGTRIGIDVPTLEIKAGERVAIIGGVGSGKSTLLRVMSGLYAPASGSVIMGGLDIAQIAPDVLRRALGYLPQDTRLLNGTLRENILLGLADPGDAALIGAIDEVGLADLVGGHPRGLDLLISEGGRGLSGGQRTLANLARLFLAQPDLWLLDEPTANLDQATESRALEGLKRRLTPGRTLVLVTHRMSLLALTERVIVMQNGKVALDGPTASVIAQLQSAAAAHGAGAGQ